MKTKQIFLTALSVIALTACEDYTEHNFGKDSELWQASQVNKLEVELTDANYAEIANNAENQAKAKAALADTVYAEDGSIDTIVYPIYDELMELPTKKYFHGNITAEEYVPAVLKSLVGANQYYAMTSGSSITVTYKLSNDSTVNGPAYVPATSMKAGSYLLAPVGVEQVLANSNDAANDKVYTYGYVYLSGTERCPGAVTRISESAITIDDNAKKHLYTFTAAGSNYTILGPTGEYLYLDETHNSFQYTEDVEDLDDVTYAQWAVTKNDDGTFDITNVANGKVVLFGTKYASAGAYTDKKGTDGYAGINLYKEGTVSSIVDGPANNATAIFQLDEEGWSAKVDYLNTTLLGYSSSNMDDIKAYWGWTIQYPGGIGELTYVWQATSSYGLKASAYKSKVNYPTNSWIVSPVMNLRKAKNPLLTFQMTQRFAATPYEEYLQILVSTDYAGDVTTCSWDDLSTTEGIVYNDGTAYDYMDNYVDLSAYNGQTNVVVAFRYISTDTSAATWEVKNVVCKEKEGE